jgi:hypothetical protein
VTGRIRGWFSALVPLALVVGMAAGCADRASKGDCEKLLTHMIKLDAEEAGAEGTTPEVAADLEQQQKDLAKDARDSFIKQCRDNTAPKYVSCALQKKTKAALAECSKI